MDKRREKEMDGKKGNYEEEYGKEKAIWRVKM